MKNMVKNFFKQHGLGSKVGIGITEVLIASMVLGFMCVALNKLQSGNHETYLRIRGRDAATEVAQNLLDSLRSVGASSVPSHSEADKDTTFVIGDVERTWDRGLGGKASIKYSRKLTVYAKQDYEVKNESKYENTRDDKPLPHVYAKQVDVEVSWPFKGSTQSITVSGVIR